MKAIVYRNYGGPEVLGLDEVPKPVPSASEVLVRVKAAGVNPADWQIRSGKRTRLPEPFTMIPGLDLSGVVEEPGQSGLEPGIRVFGMAPLRLESENAGSYAEFVSVPAEQIVPMSDTMSFEDAAALPVAVLTAWNSLFERAQLSPGQSVLVHAAAGGVGHIAVQMAKNAGAYVYGTASSRNLAFLQDIGVDRPIDYSIERFEDVAKDVDIVLDGVVNDADPDIDRAAVDTRLRSWQSLRPDGILVSITGLPDSTMAESFSVRSAYGFAFSSREALLHASDLYERGKLRPHISQLLPLESAAEAHAISERGHTRGKIVLKVSA
jgi:NADPH:quinone reductase-like Zn-dependent oxidoreductase